MYLYIAYLANVLQLIGFSNVAHFLGTWNKDGICILRLKTRHSNAAARNCVEVYSIL